MISRGVAPDTPLPARLANEPIKSGTKNFSTEKFSGANSARSIQNIAYLPDRLNARAD